MAKKCPLGQGCGEKNAPWGKGSAVLMTKNGKREKEIERKERKEEKREKRQRGGEREEMGIAKNLPCRFGNTRYGEKKASLGKVWREVPFS